MAGPLPKKCWLLLLKISQVVLLLMFKMKFRSGILRPVMLLLLGGMLMTSCSVEQRLGKDYVKTAKEQAIMVSPAFRVYKYNPGAVIDTVQLPDPEMQDSAAFFQSLFLQFVSDSVFLEKFTNSMLETFTKLGYDAMLDESSEAFLASSKPAWIVNLSQLQLEEDYRDVYLYTDEDGEPVNDPTYLYSMALNTWMEVSPVNNGSSRKELLFLTLFMEEDVHAVIDFSFLEGQFEQRFNIDRISLDDIYKMAEVSGQKHAYLLFDYFMNDYIRQQMPAGHGKRELVHYDPIRKAVKKGNFERFDVIR